MQQLTKPQKMQQLIQPDSSHSRTIGTQNDSKLHKFFCVSLAPRQKLTSFKFRIYRVRTLMAEYTDQTDDNLRKRASMASTFGPPKMQIVSKIFVRN
jgi:hypothetical protein